MNMKIGYAQTIITPYLDQPVYLAGFGNNRRAEDIHDDLYARALAISASEMTLVLCALDLIGFFRPDALQVAERLKVSTEGSTISNLQVVVASTHTHHGPDTMGLWGPSDRLSGVNPSYQESLKDKIVATLQLALQKLVTVCAVKMTSVHVPGVAKNARNPEIVDDELTLLQFLAPEDKPLATLFNFPCHPEVLWEHNPHLTADYPGYLRDEVEKLSGAPCLFFSGALGGMMTPDVKDHSFVEAEWMGNKLAEEGLQALNAVPGEQVSSVSLAKKEIAPKLTNPLYKIALRRRLLPDVRDRQGRVHSEVNLIKLGEAWFATVPGELLPKLGLQIKADLKAAGARVAGVIGLANDELGYILPVEDFKYPWNPFKPGKHYEETNSIGKEIGPKIMEAVRGLL